MSGVRHTPVTWPGREAPPTTAGEKRFFALRFQGREFLLPPGEFVIGRSRSCDLNLQDMLVSRRHARLFVSNCALFLEDLESANGVRVNEQPLSGARVLDEGDRILIGTSELTVCVSDSAVRFDTAPPPGHKRSLSGPQAFGVPAPAMTERDMPVVVPSPPQAAQHAAETSEDLEDTQRTTKADALLTMARLADRMITMGRKEAAERLLADHMDTLLRKAREGGAIDPATLEIAGLYGMKLADVSLRGRWANMAIELFRLAKRPLPLKAVTLLESLIRRLADFDHAGLAAYKVVLRQHCGSLTGEEAVAAERILSLAVS